MTPTPSLPDATMLAVASSPDAGASPAVEPAPPVPDAEPAEVVRPPVRALRGDGGVIRKLASAAAAACVGVSCAGGTANTRRDEAEPCPPGAAEAMVKLRLNKKPMEAIFLEDDLSGMKEVREGERTFFVREQVGQRVNAGSTMRGRVVFKKNVTRIFFTEAILKDGTAYPVCMEYFDIFGNRWGWKHRPQDPEETATVRYMPSQLENVIAVERFNLPHEE